MLSTRNRPSESVIPTRSVPEIWITALTSGVPWMLSIATPWRYPIVDEPASGPVEPGAGAIVVGVGFEGAGAEGVTLGREVGACASAELASRSAPTAAGSEGRRMAGIYGGSGR